MKFVYIFITLALVILNIIVYFQNVTNVQLLHNLSFLNSGMGFASFLLYIMVSSFIAGFLGALGVNKILNANKEFDDGFDL